MFVEKKIYFNNGRLVLCIVDVYKVFGKTELDGNVKPLKKTKNKHRLGRETAVFESSTDDYVNMCRPNTESTLNRKYHVVILRLNPYVLSTSL